MPESPFYAKAMRGASRLIDHWLLLGQAAPDHLAIILADTAIMAKLGDPGSPPSGATLREWSRDTQPPMWAARTALFLLVQIPSRPTPRDEDEACAWAYCWLRNRRFDDAAQALEALPGHLHEALARPLERAWTDHQSQRLV